MKNIVKKIIFVILFICLQMQCLIISTYAGNEQYKIYYYAEHTNSIYHKDFGYYTELYTIHINDDYSYSNKYNKDIYCTEKQLDEIGEENSNVYELTQVLDKLSAFNYDPKDGKPREHRYISVVVDKHIKVHNNKNKWFSLFGDENYGNSGFIDLRNLDTSSLTSTEAMFYAVQVGTINLSNINLSNVTNMSYMFGHEELGSGSAYITEINFKGVDTSNVINMRSMFEGLTSIKNLDLSGFNTSKVTDMNSMFALMFDIEELDLSSFDTRNVTNMEGMFAICHKLETIYVSDKFKVNYESNPRNFDGMFMDTENIVGGNGTTVNDLWYYSDGDSGDVIYCEKVQEFLKNRSYNDQGLECSFVFANIDTENNPGFFTNISDKGKKKDRKKDTDNNNPKNTDDNDDIKETDIYDPSLNGWIGDSLYNNGVKVKNEWILNSEGLHHIGADGTLDRSKWVDGNYIDENGVVVKSEEIAKETETPKMTEINEVPQIDRDNAKDIDIISFETGSGNCNMTNVIEDSKRGTLICYNNGVVGIWHKIAEDPVLDKNEAFGISREVNGDKTIITMNIGEINIYNTNELIEAKNLIKNGIFLGVFNYKGEKNADGTMTITEIWFKKTSAMQILKLSQEEQIIVPQFGYPRLYVHMYLANTYYPDGNIQNDTAMKEMKRCE